MNSEINYLSGFRQHHETEAVSNTIPKQQNSPQIVAHGLYAEQVNGSAFTAARHQNLKTWLYRIQPSVTHGEFAHFHENRLLTNSTQPPSPTRLRWDPIPIPEEPKDLMEGLITFADNGSPTNQSGAAIHHYAFNTSMTKHYFYSADGEMLFVPQLGELRFKTELGILDVKPGEILVIPRGIKFQVHVLDKEARGYICENFAAPFNLPELGPIGANGLANPRHFQVPVAHYEEVKGDFHLVCKFHGRLWQAPIDHSPFDVVAWQGNYTPYKYDLSLFNTINTVSFDHPDPSIFTVLTAPTNAPGIANIDFVIFPPRWMVAEHTFRPPYFHRNIMSEYMGLIQGVYDAKQDEFAPGGASLHNCMSAHGPDAASFERAINEELKPMRYRNTLAFMFESYYAWCPTDYAMQTEYRQKQYVNCWQGLHPNFKV